uniref:Integrase catalytic domain-containing protein n=1 Tax=Takifugu rubripes TaxID=31033 RepID=A0A674P2A1_TAKRU
MAADVQTFVASCSECTRSKPSHRPPAGLLQPLPIPPRPWSHIALDFITGLPPSEGSDTVLTVVNRFSKAVHFVPLPKLPTTLETANLLVQHVFHLHGIPQDIVSDRGPQFTSQVWKAFCRALGTTSRTTSGYHPQSSGQTERANQSLESSLRCVASRLPSSWASHLPWPGNSDAAVPSVRAQFRRIRQVWWETRAVLGRTAERNRRLADRHRAPASTTRWASKRGSHPVVSGRHLEPGRSPKSAEPPAHLQLVTS